jgi:hypothetical protein
MKSCVNALIERIPSIPAPVKPDKPVALQFLPAPVTILPWFYGFHSNNVIRVVRCNVPGVQSFPGLSRNSSRNAPLPYWTFL